MRLRMKLRLGLAALLALLFIVLVIYLFAIPRIPTGYDEIARLHQADLQSETEKAAAPAPARVVLSTPSHASTAATHPASSTSSRPPAAPPSSPETARQQFQRCWAAFVNYDETRWSSAHRKAYGSIYDLLNDANYSAGSTTVLTVSLTPTEGDELGKLTGNTPAYSQALRRIVDPKLALMEPLSRPRQVTSASLAVASSLHLSPAVRAVKAAAAVGAPPLPEAAELLALPAGAVPTLPTVRDKDHGYRLVPVLAQAYLYALAHDPAFDAVAALRRIRELQNYSRMALYPCRYHFIDQEALETLLHILIAGDWVEARRRAALAAEFARLQREDHDGITTNGDKLRRYQAEYIYNDLTAAFEKYLNGSSYNGNTMHFMLNGKPEHLWMRANAGNVRRHIERYAVAVARGNVGETLAARESLRSVLRLVNMDFKENVLFNYFGRSDPSILPFEESDDTAILFALKIYWFAHHQLPASLSDLTPDWLPKPAPSAPGAVSWITKIGGQPALVQGPGNAGPFPAELQQVASDPKKFRAAFRRLIQGAVIKTGKRPIPQLTDARIEQVRHEILSHPVPHSYRLSATPLDFALPAPPHR